MLLTGLLFIAYSQLETLSHIPPHRGVLSSPEAHKVSCMRHRYSFRSHQASRDWASGESTLLVQSLLSPLWSLHCNSHEMNLGNTPGFCTWKYLLPVILVKILSLWNHVRLSDPVELQLNLGMSMFSKYYSVMSSQKLPCIYDPFYTLCSPSIRTGRLFMFKLLALYSGIISK